MHDSPPTELDARGLRIGLVVSLYHREITEPLERAAVETFRSAGGAEADLLVAAAPGAFELTAVAGALARRRDVDGVVALGCVIRGETSHDQHIASALAHGLTLLTLETGTPVAFGVLTCHTLAQARARAGGDHGNKGAETMAANIEAARTLAALADAAGASP